MLRDVAIEAKSILSRSKSVEKSVAQTATVANCAAAEFNGSKRDVSRSVAMK